MNAETNTIKIKIKQDETKAKQNTAHFFCTITANRTSVCDVVVESDATPQGQRTSAHALESLDPSAFLQ
jgi:hypothetical protein